MRVQNIPSESVELTVNLGPLTLGGELHLPEGASGIVIFAHGSGSSRHSPRNQFVARFFTKRRLGAFLFDLLTEREEQEEYFTRHLRFDIPMLADRLEQTSEWLMAEGHTEGLPIGFFGASTGAAAALIAAARLGSQVKAVVSRGGRADLAKGELEKVEAPTLLIVGGQDEVVIDLNEEAYAELRCKKRLSIIPGATHLFEEPGTLETVASQAADWFQKHFKS